MYKVTFKKTAVKELHALPKKSVEVLIKSIFQLQVNPRPEGCKKLKGTKLNLWRIRTGDYRVIYIIDDEIKIVDVQKVGHRRDIYE